MLELERALETITCNLFLLQMRTLRPGEAKKSYPMFHSYTVIVWGSEASVLSRSGSIN